MKKLLLCTLIAAMLLLPMGSIALAEDDTAAPAAPVQNEAYTPGEAPARDLAASMAPAVHAVLLAMENQGVSSFSTDSELLSWEMLYNLLSMYGQLDERSAYDGEQLVLPSETVRDYSAALFAAPLSPDTLPAELADRMTYDADSDCYYLYCGSDALSEVTLTAAEEAQGELAVSGKLMFVAEDLELASFTATLTAADNLFGYTLVGLDVD